MDTTDLTQQVRSAHGDPWQVQGRLRVPHGGDTAELPGIRLIRSHGRAGPAVYLAGVAVLPHARGRGIGGALSSWLIQRALTDGAQLAHLHPDTDAAARIYARLGFEEVGGFDVYVDS